MNAVAYREFGEKRSSDIQIDDINNSLSFYNRNLEDFSTFYDNRDKLEHAYNTLSGIKNKPSFSEVYSLVKLFIEPFANNVKDVEWNHNNMIWDESPADYYEDKDIDPAAICNEEEMDRGFYNAIRRLDHINYETTKKPDADQKI